MIAASDSGARPPKKGMSLDVVRQLSRHRSLGTLMIYRDLDENRQATFPVRIGTAGQRL